MRKQETEASSSLYLTHRYASFNGCTLQEVFVLVGLIALVELPIVLISAIFLAPCVNGYLGACLLLALAFGFVGFFAMKSLTRKVGELRKGKAPGYFEQVFCRYLAERCGFKIPYVRNQSGYFDTKWTL